MKPASERCGGYRDESTARASAEFTRGTLANLIGRPVVCRAARDLSAARAARVISTRTARRQLSYST